MALLPLFPLSTVLYPGMPLSLHIFEDRYKLMMRHCIEAGTPFGVVLIRQGREAFGPPAQPYLVGCTAVIREVQRLVNDRMNIIVVGQDRFRILEFDRSQPYLQAHVDMIPMQEPDKPTVRRAVAQLRPALRRYLELRVRAEELQLDVNQLPAGNNGDLANLAAYFLRIPNELKQQLLELPSRLDFIQQVTVQIRREAALLDVMLRPDVPDSQGPFSLS